MDILIRLAEDSDTDSLIELTRETISVSYREFLDDELVDEFIDAENLDEYVSESIRNCLVMVVRDEVIGACVFDEGFIDLLIIAHDLQRSGLGSKLLDYTEQLLFTKFAILKLESFEDNERANTFYLKRGWRPVRTFYDEDSEASKTVLEKRR